MERRFSVKLRDITGIDIGITVAEFTVIAESAPEAEMYVREYMGGCCCDSIECPILSPWEMVTREIPTT